MSIFKVNLVACNPQQRALVTMPVAAVVDTGSDLTWLPAEALRSIGITPNGRRMFKSAKNGMVEREVGLAILQVNGNETTQEVVFCEAWDAALIGARTLAAFGVKVEDGFISLNSMMSFSAKHVPDSFSKAA